ncbi:hypothetical protein RIF29_19076 [Crotalaria pallida]|uniref:Uncharacterized protein n=1 Tax=Crotalaria pallida TaxID=3830 RepID=A0AAN9EYS8_CROPI
MEGSLGVRKGAWSKLEDDLLRACVQQYGEGKWHLVPKRAGLNRCRKSCRLRWLNYLNPNIKRGMFDEDEVDLMLRLHRLLGNRWSLIAGRLPGRTPNDVKNYWNSYIRKKVSSHKKDVNNTRPNKTVIEPHIVIKPQPRTISRTSSWLREKLLSDEQSRDKQCTHDKACSVANSSRCNNNWWGTMLEDIESNEKKDTCWLGEQDGALLKDLNCNDAELFSLTTEVENFLGEGQSWSDVLDMNWAQIKMGRNDPGYYSPPWRGYGDRGRSTPSRRGYNGGGSGGSRRRESNNGSFLVIRLDELRIHFERFGPVFGIDFEIFEFILDWFVRGQGSSSSRQDPDIDAGIQNVRIFTYKELIKATDDFSPSNKIGEGGFGFVYKFCSVGDDSCLILWDARVGSSHAVKNKVRSIDETMEEGQVEDRGSPEIQTLYLFPVHYEDIHGYCNLRFNSSNYVNACVFFLYLCLL